MAVIGLEGMHFEAKLGYHKEERLTGNQFIVDVYVDTKTAKTFGSGNLGNTINYETIYFICQKLFKDIDGASEEEFENGEGDDVNIFEQEEDKDPLAEKYNRLIETAAYQLFSRIQGHFNEQLLGLRVKLTKLNPPLGGIVERAFIDLKWGTFGLPNKDVFKTIKDSNVLDKLDK